MWNLANRAGELFARGNKGPAVDDAPRRSLTICNAGSASFRSSTIFLPGSRHLTIAERRAMIAPEAGLSVSRQCALLGLTRSSFY